MSPLKDKYSLILCLLLSAYTGLSFAERADREKPIQMEADSVTLDDTKQLSTFQGNVRLQQGTLLIEADRILVLQDKKGFSQATATGQLAHLRQKRDGVNEYADGYGERIEYDSYAEVANIYGQARIKREGDDVRGEHIIYNTKTGVFQVFGASDQTAERKPEQGRVTIVIQPKTHVKEPATNAHTPPVNSSTTPTQPQ